MMQLFESLVGNNGAPFSGARVTAKGKKITTLLIGGKEIDLAKNYKVVTSDYLAGGGDKYSFFSSPLRPPQTVPTSEASIYYWKRS